MAMASDAAVEISGGSNDESAQCLPMPLSFVGAGVLARLDFSSLAESVVMVAVEGDLEKVLARGPRCVSLSSVICVNDVSPPSLG